jgi:hypothetical protein
MEREVTISTTGKGWMVCRILWTSSIPSIRGIIQSETIASHGWAARISKAATPSDAFTVS